MGNDNSANRTEGKDIDRVVIGIDPASGKDSYVFAPELNLDGPMSPSELRSLLPSRDTPKHSGRKPFGTECCLVCWDAPLTGPRHPDIIDITMLSEEEQKKESLTTRAIERTGEKALKRYREIADAATRPGVSVRGFSGLSHWVISRNVLGLPRVGRFDAPFEELPLYPIFMREELSKHRWAVTEVHPTLAVYLWMHDPGAEKGKSWRQYKGNDKEPDVANAVQAMWKKLHNRFVSNTSYQLSRPMSDDAFDARVAWLLGYLWLQGDAVELVGNGQDGSFLLPKDESTSS